MDCRGRSEEPPEALRRRGEEVVLGVDDDASDFNALHSRKHNSEAQL